jgi:hypothetical protein
MPNYNTHLIKARRSYSMNQIASLFNIDRKTCHRWLKSGLKVIEKGVNPLLVMGADLVSFLKEKREKQKVPLAANEFFCMKCHKPVRAKTGSEKIVKTGKWTGKSHSEQLKKIGVCEICGTRLHRLLKASQPSLMGYSSLLVNVPFNTVAIIKSKNMISIAYKNETMKRRFFDYLENSKRFSKKTIEVYEGAIWVWEDFSHKADFAKFNKTGGGGFQGLAQDQEEGQLGKGGYPLTLL